jgi:hypothetical protein
LYEDEVLHIEYLIFLKYLLNVIYVTLKGKNARNTSRKGGYTDRTGRNSGRKWGEIYKTQEDTFTCK